MRGVIPRLLLHRRSVDEFHTVLLPASRSDCGREPAPFPLQPASPLRRDRLHLPLCDISARPEAELSSFLNKQSIKSYYPQATSGETLVTILRMSGRFCTHSLELGTDVFTNTSLLCLTTADNTSVDSTRHTVLLLNVELREGVLYAMTETTRALRS